MVMMIRAILLALKDLSIVSFKSSNSVGFVVIDILACNCRIKAMSGVLESSRFALSIVCSSKVKYESFVNRLN